MQTIVIIEDEKPIADILKYGLEKQEYEVFCAHRGGEGCALVMEKKPDLVLLDLMLPDCSGITVCQTIRERLDIPIIMLTAKSGIEDKLRGLEAGAEDYITKPFDIREVVARVGTVLRRVKKANGSHLEDGVLKIGQVRIDKNSYKVYVKETEIEMTPKEFELLFYLVEHADIVLTREMLLEQVWGYDYIGDTRTVDTHIQRLRKKLQWNDKIQTVYGVGYRYSSHVPDI